MRKIISDTEVAARDYFKNFGFNEEQINTLIVQGKNDLNKELTKLEILLSDETSSLADINNVLHALKGLIFQLGNYDVAEKLNEIRSHHDRASVSKEISQLLFD